jgi:hypothetical protein
MAFKISSLNYFRLVLKQLNGTNVGWIPSWSLVKIVSSNFDY